MLASPLWEVTNSPNIFVKTGFSAGGQRRPPLQRVRVGNTHSDLHQFLFLAGQQFVDLLAAVIRQLLKILFCLLQIILGDLGSLFLLLEGLHGIPADVADKVYGQTAYDREDMSGGMGLLTPEGPATDAEEEAFIRAMKRKKKKKRKGLGM